MTRYKLQQIDGVVTSVLWVDKNMGIPFDPDNTDYQEYLEWLAKGNTPLPADN